MSTFAFVFLCIQACLVQSIFSQCTSRAAVADISGLTGPYGFAAPYGLTAPCGRTGPYGLAARGIAANGIIPELIAPGISAPYGLTSPLSYDGLGYPGVASYGGTGEGNVAVAGQLPVTGTTNVAGQIPIMGAVSFGGPVAAAGSVSIFGKCACGCNSPIYY